MKMKIEIWQSEFNNEWNCDITTTENGYDETKSWSVENFCDILKLCTEHFPKAKFKWGKV